MPHKKQNLWEYHFAGSPRDERQEKILQYVVHRVRAGAHLGDVVEEEYVRRHATRDEVDVVICHPELVHAAREGMESVFESGELRPQARSR